MAAKRLDLSILMCESKMISILSRCYMQNLEPIGPIVAEIYDVLCRFYHFLHSGGLQSNMAAK